MRKWLLFILLSNLLLQVDAEDGYKLWLRYAPISDPHQKENIQEIFDNVFITGNSSTFQAIKNELAKAGQGFINQLPMFANQFSKTTSLIITSKRELPFDVNNVVNKKINALGNEGFMIDRLEHNQKNYLTIVANTSVGALYGTFHLFRLMQTGNLVESLPVIEIPKMNRRILNHWDNLDRTIERGYAGFSIWDWHKLPDYISPRYIDYARANASISINGTVLTSVNANAFALTPQYIEKVAALADVLRP